MTTLLEQNILIFIRQRLLGVELKSNIYGDAGRDFEDKMEHLGFPINRGSGVDLPHLGWEIKTRKTSATSAQTITSMFPDDIINTPYKLSPVYEKFRKQLRVYTNDYDKIKSIDLYDFDKESIQNIMELSYEKARSILIANKDTSYTPYQGLGVYFEKTHKDRPELDIRVADTVMKKLEGMSKSNFQNLFV